MLKLNLEDRHLFLWKLIMILCKEEEKKNGDPAEMEFLTFKSNVEFFYKFVIMIIEWKKEDPRKYLTF